MKNTIQLYTDESRKVKGYPITSPDRVLYGDGKSIKDKLKKTVKFDVVGEGVGAPPIEGEIDKIKEQVESISEQLGKTIRDSIDFLTFEQFGAKADINNKIDDTEVVKQTIIQAKELNKSIKLLSSYYLTDTIDLSGVHVYGTDYTKNGLVFELAGSKDGIVLYDHKPHTLCNMYIDMQGHGRDCVVVYSADRPIFENLNIKNSGRDSISFIAISEWHWIENIRCNNVLINQSGRHGFYFEVGNETANFINENVFQHCEIRGIGRRYANSSFIYANSKVVGGLSNGSKMSMFNWLSCNFDAEGGGALGGRDRLGNAINFNVDNGYSGNFEAWKFTNGGYENMDSTSVPKYVFGCSGTGIFNFNGLRCDGVTRNNYHYWFDETILKDDTIFINVLGLDCILPKSDKLKVTNLTVENITIPDEIELNKIINASKNSSITINIPFRNNTERKVKNYKIDVSLHYDCYLSDNNFSQSIENIVFISTVDYNDDVSIRNNEVFNNGNTYFTVVFTLDDDKKSVNLIINTNDSYSGSGGREHIYMYSKVKTF